MRAKITVRRATARLLSTLGVAASVGIAAAPAAHADAGACGAGYACVYVDNGLSGISNVYKNTGNASPNLTMTTPDGGFVWNNGRTSELQVTEISTNGRRYVFCLTHGNPVEADGDTNTPTYRRIYTNETVVSWTWRSSRCSDSLYREPALVV